MLPEPMRCIPCRRPDPAAARDKAGTRTPAASPARSNGRINSCMGLLFQKYSTSPPCPGGRAPALAAVEATQPPVIGRRLAWLRSASARLALRPPLLASQNPSPAKVQPQLWQQQHSCEVQKSDSAVVGVKTFAETSAGGDLQRPAAPLTGTCVRTRVHVRVLVRTRVLEYHGTRVLGVHVYSSTRVPVLT